MFIELTESQIGLPIVVNTNHIVSIIERGEKTDIQLVTNFVTVSESYEDVKKSMIYGKISV